MDANSSIQHTPPVERTIKNGELIGKNNTCIPTIEEYGKLSLMSTGS